MVDEAQLKTFLVFLFFAILSVFLIGVFWLATTPVQTVGLTLAFAAGLSMIALPCTLPLVFVIVPMSMGQGYRKGLLMAVLFGLGLTITISLYGVAVALFGQYVGLDQATRAMWSVAGLAAYLFGLTQLGFVAIALPAYTGVPSFIQKQGDYAKSFLLGLLLGNAGVGCPNPAFYVLLTYIASVGSVAYGAELGLVHGLGRALPLIAFAVLGILGVNVAQSIARRRMDIERFTGWALILVGAFILSNGIFGHLWYESSLFHSGLNRLWATTVGAQVAEVEIHTTEMEASIPYAAYAPWFLLALAVAPVLYGYYRSRNATELAILLLVTLLLWAGVYPLPGGGM